MDKGRSPVHGGNRTHEFSFTGRALYRFATTSALHETLLIFSDSVEKPFPEELDVQSRQRGDQSSVAAVFKGLGQRAHR